MRKQYWKNWSTRDDLVSLGRWERTFGDDFRGLFVFAYNVHGRMRRCRPSSCSSFGGRTYGFVAIPTALYARHARQLSPRWDTVTMPTRVFLVLAAPLERAAPVSGGIETTEITEDAGKKKTEKEAMIKRIGTAVVMTSLLLAWPTQRGCKLESLRRRKKSRPPNPI